MITMENEGQLIVRTNYWDSDLAQAGFFFLSWNARAGRLLIPQAHESSLNDMLSAQCVIISRGPWRDREGLELLFEDNTDNPYAIRLGVEQCDRLIPDSEQGGGFVVALWTRDGLKAWLPGKYRTVKQLPCLEPWISN
ncbi:hypothetical protein [Marinimicrobium sp. ABcell2]|uniref:hypothetical protein n=1 Tax=Marinimicrobium sp. ABcell2 TaxID=3069751 RepID=UPI0027B7ECAB|nr:hypothetical protein [Marinimicrobium sp. ABcell2]MDQ2077445.1 hypothetical protein [Marinimicrobium sp. ABcell2]